MTVDILKPPFPSAGTGSLRVVRVVERPDGAAFVAAYEGYERL